MIKAQELRIGNYVSIRDDIRKVNSVSGHPRGERISTTIKGCTFAECHFSEEKVKPVAISEEWLVKLGFIDHSKDWFALYIIEEDGFCVSYHKEDKLFYIGVDAMPHLKYIHQLQNLYQSLTGEELIIK